MDKTQFVEDVIRISRKKGFKVETNNRDQRQIDFGNKKLHTGHLEQLFPEILEEGAHIPTLIENVAPGRPCTHKPMREIIAEIGHEKRADEGK